MRGKILVVLMLALVPVFASVRASVDENPVIAGESVEFSIEARGESVEFPKIEKIGDVPVTEEGSQRFEHFENNRTVVEWVKLYALTPKRSVTIPSYTVIVDGKAEKTKPIYLQVKSAGGSGTENFRLKLSSDKHEAYVGEMVTVTLRFYEKKEVPVMHVEFPPIRYENFWVKRVGSEKRYAQNGFLVHEIRYLFFPQKPGKLLIGPASVKVAVAKKMRDAFGFIVRRPQWMTLQTNPVPLEVKPLPHGVKLVGRFQIEADAKPKSVRSGDPVELFLKVEGEGNIEDYEPPALSLGGVTIYADAPKVSQNYSHGIYRGLWQRRYLLIAEKSFVIPPFSLRYLDPATGEVRTRKTEPIAIAVKSGEKGPLASTRECNTDGHGKRQAPMTEKFWIALIAFAAGMATMYLLHSLGKMFEAKREERSGRPSSDKAMLQRLMPYVHRYPEAAVMAENLYAKIYEGKPVAVDRKQFEAFMKKLEKRG